MLSACFVHLYFNPKLNNPATCLVMDSTVAHSTSIYIYMRCMCSYFAKKEVVVRANQTSRGDDRKAYRRLGFRHAEINWTTTREKVSKFIINSPSCISLLGGQSSSVSHTQSGYSWKQMYIYMISLPFKYRLLYIYICRHFVPHRWINISDGQNTLCAFAPQIVFRPIDSQSVLPVACVDCPCYYKPTTQK